jgi:hypothetical protein
MGGFDDMKTAEASTIAVSTLYLTTLFFIFDKR